jgi:hypothetical protein
MRRSKFLDANELIDSSWKLAGTLRRARQTQWARELEDILDSKSPDNQKLGEIVTVLRRLNGTSLPPMLGLTDSLGQLISGIEKFFKTKK